uniref:IclR family transcriptional regulator domain-containing protein n=2 Tax=Pseudomonadota TaxID=1224 RepID=UPI0034D5DE59
EEHEADICCVAAPIHANNRHFVAGISVTGPAYRITPDVLQSWAGITRTAAAAIMANMATRLSPRA